MADSTPREPILIVPKATTSVIDPGSKILSVPTATSLDSAEAPRVSVFSDQPVCVNTPTIVAQSAPVFPVVVSQPPQDCMDFQYGPDNQCVSPFVESVLQIDPSSPFIPSPLGLLLPRPEMNIAALTPEQITHLLGLPAHSSSRPKPLKVLRATPTSSVVNSVPHLG